MTRSVDSRCDAFQLAIDVLGRPWTALILNLLQPGPMRFSELAAAADGPGDKILSARLKELEAKKLVVRRVEAGPPVKVTYELSACGHAFQDVALAIQKWGHAMVADARPRRR